MSRADGTRLLYLLLKQVKPGQEAVQFVAAASGDGTSSMVRDLGLIAGGLGIRVLILDLDTSEARGTGWSWASVAHPAGGEDASGPEFTLLQVGSSSLYVSTPIPSLASVPSRTAEVLTRLRGKFELILIDVAAFDRSADALLLAPTVFGTCLVVATERSRVRAVDDLRTQIQECGGSTLGMVLNRWRRYMPQFIEDRL